MIRPIDTQILYPQAPELSNRQQANKHHVEGQQQQFADAVHKQSQAKKEMVQKAEKDEKVNNNEKEKQSSEQQSKNDKQHKKDKDTKTGQYTHEKGSKQSTIDIKI